MSIVVIIGVAAMFEGIMETSTSCFSKAKRYIARQIFRHKQRVRRKRRRTFE